MTVHVECEVTPGFSFHYRKLARQVIEASLDMENFPYECEITLTLTDNDGIHEINREMREIDRPTDVLSFPMLQYPAAGDFSRIDEQVEYSCNPETGEVILGDIVISCDKIREQAAEYGHSEKREYAFLITHSMLHLMGYDHMVPEDASLMEAHQKVILDQLKIYRK